MRDDRMTSVRASAAELHEAWEAVQSLTWAMAGLTGYARRIAEEVQVPEGGDTVYDDPGVALDLMARGAESITEREGDRLLQLLRRLREEAEGASDAQP